MLKIHAKKDAPAEDIEVLHKYLESLPAKAWWDFMDHEIQDPKISAEIDPDGYVTISVAVVAEHGIHAKDAPQHKHGVIHGFKLRVHIEDMWTISPNGELPMRTIEFV